jgi:hypothetical protein
MNNSKKKKKKKIPWFSLNWFIFLLSKFIRLKWTIYFLTRNIVAGRYFGILIRGYLFKFKTLLIIL